MLGFVPPEASCSLWTELSLFEWLTWALTLLCHRFPITKESCFTQVKTKRGRSGGWRWRPGKTRQYQTEPCTEELTLTLLDSRLISLCLKHTQTQTHYFFSHVLSWHDMKRITRNAAAGSLLPFLTDMNHCFIFLAENTHFYRVSLPDVEHPISESFTEKTLILGYFISQKQTRGKCDPSMYEVTFTSDTAEDRGNINILKYLSQEINCVLND